MKVRVRSGAQSSFSALTTVMVFIPVLIMELEAGQLFRDIAVAISVAVMLSLVVAVTVIPALTNRLFGGNTALHPIRLPIIDWFANGFKRFIVGYARMTNASPAFGLLVVTAISSGAIWAALTYLPEQEYLPDGNRNLVFGVIIPPPGYNLETTTRIAERIESTARPLWEKDVNDPDGPPAIDSFFFVATPGNSFLGASAQDGSRVGELDSGPVETDFR